MIVWSSGGETSGKRECEGVMQGRTGCVGEAMRRQAGLRKGTGASGNLWGFVSTDVLPSEEGVDRKEGCRNCAGREGHRGTERIVGRSEPH